MVTYIRRYKLQNLKIFLLISLSNTIYVSCSFIGMRMAKSVMDGSLKKMVMLMLLNSTMWGIFSIVEYFQETSIAKTVALMNQGMRAQICENMVKKQYTEYNEKNVGEYIS